MSLTVSCINNTYCHYKFLQVIDPPTGLGNKALTNTSVTLYWSSPTLHPNCIVNYTVALMEYLLFLQAVPLMTSNIYKEYRELQYYLFFLNLEVHIIVYNNLVWIFV